MNSCNFLGRLTAEPELTHSLKDPNLAICKYTLAVDRRFSKEDKADFIRIVAFGKAGEFASKWFHKGKRVLVQSRVQVDQYVDKEGKKAYSYVFVAENQEFADAPVAESTKQEKEESIMAGFMEIPEGVDDEIPI